MLPVKMVEYTFKEISNLNENDLFAFEMGFNYTKYFVFKGERGGQFLIKSATKEEEFEIKGEEIVIVVGKFSRQFYEKLMDL